MWVIDRIRQIQQQTIHVPLYHRGHLSLFPGTEVFLSVYPILQGMDAQRSTLKLPEMLGTTIRPASWPFVLCIRAVLDDRAGAVESLVNAVFRHGGNILYLDSSSIEHERFHVVEAVVDFRSQSSACTSVEDLSRTAGGLLLAECAQYVEWSYDEPRLTVRPIRSLQRMHNALSRMAPTSELVFKSIVDKKGRIRLPNEIVHILNLQMHENFGESSRISANSESRYTLTSDTNHRTFKVHFLSKQRLVVWCGFWHRDVRGALAAITKKIRADGTTIVTSLNRVQSHLGFSWFEAILSHENWTCDRPSNVEEKIAKIRKALKDRFSNHDNPDFQIQIHFDPKERGNPPHLPPERSRAVDKFGSSQLISAAEWIESMERRGALGEPDPEKARQGATVRPEEAISRGISQVRQGTGNTDRIIFVSMAQTSETDAFTEVIRRRAKAHGYRVDIVKRPKTDTVIRRDVRRRIGAASHFLAIWTPHRHQAEDSSPPRPAPWCLWEMGVADANEIPVRVVIDDAMNDVDHKTIHPQRYPFRYGSGDAQSFEAQVDEAIRSFERDDVT